jgi:hypothetical protein
MVTPGTVGGKAERGKKEEGRGRKRDKERIGWSVSQ